MFSRKKQQYASIRPQQQSRNPFSKIIDKVISKTTTSDHKEINQQANPVKLIKSEPQLPQIQEAQQNKQQNDQKGYHLPRFMRSSSNNKQIVNWKFLSPPVKKNPLVHRPVSPKKVEQQKPYRTEVIPPSDLVHDKMKNFQQNPERFLMNVDEVLDNVFKKSIESIIRTAKVIPVKDWEIRDSTNLLDGFTGEE